MTSEPLQGDTTLPLHVGILLNDRYRVEELLGKGGFGAVYRAWDEKLDGPCAVKESFATIPELEKQFAREASFLFNLRHPALPRVFDYFIIPGKGGYLVMDYVEGDDLRVIMSRRSDPLSEDQALAWINQVCAALQYLHRQNPPIIHRDIKPANIRITPQGHAILVDFGASKMYDPSVETTLGARAITSGYSPPEQYGLGGTDARSDIYALGATLYTLLTNNKPPDSLDMLTGSSDSLVPVGDINPDISSTTQDAVTAAMQLDREARFQQVAEFQAALQPDARSSLFITSPLPQPEILPAANAPLSRGKNLTAAASQPVTQPARRGFFDYLKLLPWGVGIAFLVFVFAIIWPQADPDPLAFTQTALVLQQTQAAMNLVGLSGENHSQTPGLRLNRTNQTTEKATLKDSQRDTITPTVSAESAGTLTPSDEVSDSGFSEPNSPTFTSSPLEESPTAAQETAIPSSTSPNPTQSLATTVSIETSIPTATFSQTLPPSPTGTPSPHPAVIVPPTLTWTAVPSWTPTKKPSPTFTITPWPVSETGDEACHLSPGMKVHPSSDARLHSRPGIIDANLIDFDLSLVLTVIEGPVWEQIRLDRDDSLGWWWHVKTEVNLLDGWLWEGHIKECLP